MSTLLKSHLDQPVSSRDDLVAFLERGARSPERWGVGTEVEKLAVLAQTGEAAPYERIEDLLAALETGGRWQGVREEGRLVALVGEDSSITLEPGGQLELSGQLCPDLHCSSGDFSRHIEQIVGAAAERGIVFLGLGVQPFTPLDRIDWLPKARYRVMGPYMGRTGDRGQQMMKMTAGLQVNVDYADEADCIAKLRLCLALAPVLYALFANSPLMAGRPTGFLSTRGEIWRRTDPDRTGMLPQLFREGAGFSDYVDWALEVPMYFISRGGEFLNLTGRRFTFREFLRQGFQGHRATLTDWDLHLSTLFPEARLRPQIEVRSADSLPPEMTLGVSALIKGLLYDREALAGGWEIFRGQSPEERELLCRRSWRQGLRTPWEGRTLREVALELLELAREGLERQARRDGRGLDERCYLEPVAEIAESGVTLAERLLSRWQGGRKEKIALLREHCGFGPS